MNTSEVIADYWLHPNRYTILPLEGFTLYQIAGHDVYVVWDETGTELLHVGSDYNTAVFALLEYSRTSLGDCIRQDHFKTYALDGKPYSIVVPNFGEPNVKKT